MNPAISRITMADGKGIYFRVGDVVRLANTGEVLHVSSVRDLGPRYWHDEKIPLWRALWTRARGGEWKRRRRVVDAWWGGWIKVYRHTPTGLPRRLP